MEEKKDGRLKVAWIVSLVCIILMVVYALLIVCGGAAIGLLGGSDASAAGVATGMVGVFCLIPLVWTIPMTVRMKKIYDGTADNSTAFSICSLIFCNIISGILLLVVGNGEGGKDE